jgi:hypothetical protein
LGIKLYGEPPSPGASKLQRLIFMRRLLIGQAPGMVLLLVLAAVFVPSPLNWLLPAGSAVWWLASFGLFTVQIRREQTPEAERRHDHAVARRFRELSKLQRLIFLRRLLVGQAPGLVLLLVLWAVLLSSPLNWLLPVVFGVWWLASFGLFTVRIRRERGRVDV